MSTKSGVYLGYLRNFQKIPKTHTKYISWQEKKKILVESFQNYQFFLPIIFSVIYKFYGWKNDFSKNIFLEDTNILFQIIWN
jgi:hypothetical protein